MARQFDPYGGLRTEPDMRQEFYNTMDGRFPEIAKKQQYVHRKMRVQDGQLIDCPCVDPTTREPDKDKYCPICLGEGKLWEESLLNGYKVVLGSSVGGAGKENLISSGNTNLDLVSFYFRYNLPLTLFPKRESPDKIVELVTDTEGDPVRPYQRETIYRIGTAIDFRADNGKLEYWRLDCYEEQVKFLNGPKG